MQREGGPARKIVRDEEVGGSGGGGGGGVVDRREVGEEWRDTKCEKKVFFFSFFLKKEEKTQQAATTTCLKPINTQQLLRKFTQHKFQQLIFEALILTRFVYLTESNWECLSLLFTSVAASHSSVSTGTLVWPLRSPLGGFTCLRARDMFVCLLFTHAHTRTHTHTQFTHSPSRRSQALERLALGRVTDMHMSYKLFVFVVISVKYKVL